MSFWKQLPGPHWSDYWKSFWPFASDVTPSIFNRQLQDTPRPLRAPEKTTFVYLQGDHSEALANLIQTHYKITARSKVVLTHARLRNGFVYDGWLGCGLLDPNGSFIGCVISRPLGALHLGFQEFPDTGAVDFFCVAAPWRKKGVASFLLQELVYLTAKKHRLVHIFMKEGFPLGPLPPVWQSHYIVRKRGLPDLQKENLELIPHSLRSRIQDFIHIQSIGRTGSIFNQPQMLTGDSQIYDYKEGPWRVFMCVADTFHRSVPEDWRIGEVLWVLPTDPNMPMDIQKRALETLVDNCKFEIVLLDNTWPHDCSKGWKRDAMYGWYLFNCHPGRFFSLKPYFIV